MILRYDLQEPRYTLTLQECIEYFKAKGEDLFDFDYKPPEMKGKTPQEVKAYLTETFSNYYKFHEIGQETPDRFKQRLSIMWNLRLEKYAPMFNAYSIWGDDLVGAMTNYKNDGYSRNISEDTPDNNINLKLKEKENFPFASFATTHATENSGYTGRTPGKLMEEFLDTRREVMREFLDSFDELFMEVY